MIETYVSEFLAIVSHLKKRENACIKGNFLIIDKPQLAALLDKNKYETAENKLLVWRGLKWIDADSDNRLTKKVMTNGQSFRAIIIDLSVAATLFKLQNSNIYGGEV